MTKITAFLLISILTSFFTYSYGQDFNKIFSDLSIPKSWTRKIVLDTSAIPLFERPQIGRVVFKSKERFPHQVKFMIFKYSDSDSLHFRTKIFEYYSVSSCLNFSSNNPLENFISFEKSGYFFVLEICHFCNTADNINCRNLGLALNKWILKK